MTKLRSVVFVLALSCGGGGGGNKQNVDGSGTGGAGGDNGTGRRGGAGGFGATGGSGGAAGTGGAGGAPLDAGAGGVGGTGGMGGTRPDAAPPDSPRDSSISPTDAMTIADAPPTSDATKPRSCGGFLGLLCPTDQYCEYATGSCGNGDALGECRSKPGICSRILAPVCGCDGRTYSNDCIRQSNGVSKRADGACP